MICRRGPGHWTLIDKYRQRLLGTDFRAGAIAAVSVEAGDEPESRRRMAPVIACSGGV